MSEINKTSLSNLNNDEIAAHLPPEVLQFLVRSVPSRALWKWLSEKEQTALLQDLTRGFQRTANTLRQPIVRNRLTDHLRHDNKTFQTLLAQWSQSSPPPPVVSETLTLPDEELNVQLPSLLQRHGIEALLLSLLANERRAALDTWETLDESALQATANATEEGCVAQPSTRDATEAQVEAEARAKAQAQRDAAEQTLQKERGEKNKWRDAAHTAQKEVKALHAQLQHETQALQLRAKQEERRAVAAATLAEETQKKLDREARRLKQSETAAEELQTENKRLKRQLRQAQQIHEDLRKQLASQQMRLREAEEKLLTAQA
jgi:DNA repair exonuclease SbcCD ATPase subunit